MTSQQKLILKRLAMGLCVRCGKGPPVSKRYGAECRVIHRAQSRETMRRKRGNLPWKPGSRGCAPLADDVTGKLKSA